MKSTFVCQVEGQEDITGKQESGSHFNYYFYILCYVGALSEVKFVCHMYISAL